MAFISEEIVHIKGYPKKLIIFLHGYIDNCESLNRRIVPFLNNLNDVAIHLPEAPQSCEIHEKKRQWYSMHQFDPNDDRKTVPTLKECTDIYAHMGKGFDESYQYLSEYIDTCLNEYQLEAKDLIICGFSQGAMLALYTALRYPEKIGGCVSFSGIMATPDYFYRHSHQIPRCLLIHGDADNLVRYGVLEYSKDHLQKLGCQVASYTVKGGQHKITEDGLKQAENFIKECFKS
ncbi:MAG: hypothetical protein IJ545_07885 [Alphaproteobacteria bacterium]|nr:hypothetical protein [Alphaproteobacteria bacterium]